ncbi:mevalonate kinase [Candidatus Methanosphaera massiliense]|jgi:mevalonate kinase|uniref:mevalonate kinase n=1 Tax=Methanosphaera TaxID=2316 RepID=UPI0023809907|nr:mevalonate kinase [Candidatus Methanosphaera massiliense]MDE4078513.1 mevalonate kinase [Candidatus Methanosphaera massiliense]
MKIRSFAPGKVILFGEHSVVHGRPAIAVAISEGVQVELVPRDDNSIKVCVPSIDYEMNTELNEGKLDYDAAHGKMITDYIYEVISLFEFDKGFDLNVDIRMYLGVGLGSSAAVTVSTLKAVSIYAGKEYSKEDIADIARDVEVTVQGSASPLDTSMSTYGGMIYIDENSERNRVECNCQLPLVVVNSGISANTGVLVENVRKRYEKYPLIVGDIFSSMEAVANTARNAFIEGDLDVIGDLMNINQGLLDSLGVNTDILSQMVYDARLYGAQGSKLTGSGGGGCIIAVCPDNIDEVYDKLSQKYATFKCEISDEGVHAEIIE